MIKKNRESFVILCTSIVIFLCIGTYFVAGIHKNEQPIVASDSTNPTTSNVITSINSKDENTTVSSDTKVSADTEVSTTQSPNNSVSIPIISKIISSLEKKIVDIVKKENSDEPQKNAQVPESSATAAPTPSTIPTAESITKPNLTPKPNPTPKPQNKLVSAAIEAVDDKAKTIVTGKVTLNDYVEVYEVVVGKLSIGEIKYLIDSAKRDYWETTSVEQIEKARKILFSKLNDDDLSKLREIGRKYGRSMDIIKKDLNVAETKEKQMEAKGLK